MDGTSVATIIFLALAVHEGLIGGRLAFRTRRTLEAAGLAYDDGNGLVVQEFGVYSLGIAAAYVVAALAPVQCWAVALVGITFNLSAGMMHLLRSAGIYFGDARPVMSRGFERKAGIVHAAVVFTLVIILPSMGVLS
jgi:hypothetical protein